MNPEEAKDTAKSHLEEYLNAKGINTSSTFSCINPSHDDRHPSMSMSKDKTYCHCFSCGANYDIFNAVQFDTGLSGKELFNYVYDLYKIPVEFSTTSKNSSHTVFEQKQYKADFSKSEPQKSLTEFFEKCHKDVTKTDYWKKRGLSIQTVDAYNLGYWEEKNRFVIPTGEYSYNARAIWDADKKERYLKPKGSFELFNIKIIPAAEEPVFVVEGEFDALSVIEAGGIAVSLGSSSSNSFAEFLKNNRPKYPLILALDKDEAGQNGTDRLEENLKRIGIDYVEADITDDCKDANEALCKNREIFIQNVKNAKQSVMAILEERRQKEEAEYLKTSAVNGLQDFINEIEKRKNGDCITTGFKKLDEALDGGFYPGLYIIGAISSLGKTTLSLQIADNAAKSGRDVIVFSLEMGKQELVSKSISRLSFQKCKAWGTDYTYATTTRNLMNGKSLDIQERVDFLNQCIDDYGAYAGHIFYHIGIGDIGVEKMKNIIERHIKITGRKPLVVIDYLQIIAPYDMRATDKQNTDKAVVELKRVSRDYDVPVFAISSFNRENYTSPVNIASFKESGAIEYTSDVLMGLQFKGMDYLKVDSGKYEDEKSRTARIYALREKQEKAAETPGVAQELELKILKNRNGRKGRVDLSFYPMFNCFEEPNDWIAPPRTRK